MLRPPQHRADAPIVYVHPSDPAWDHDRIKRELADLKKDDKPEHSHPVLRYQHGHTRFDIQAIQDYLGPDATRWYFKRIGAVDWQVTEGLKESEMARGSRPHTAYFRALNLALVKVDNGPPLVGEAGKWEPEDIERIADLSFYDEDENKVVDVLFDVGQAAYVASMPLSKAEKKA